MAEFVAAFKYAEINEGGYCKVPGDRGGETYRGISRISHSDWDGWPLVDSFEPLEYNEVINDPALESKVRVFYKKEFWDKMQGDKIDSQVFAAYFFDWLINSSSKAVEKLHEVLGMGDLALKFPFDQVGVDRINEFGDKLLLSIHERRLKFYNDHVAVVPADAKFLKGWLARANNLYNFLSKHI